MSILSSIARAADAYRRRRQLSRTERMIGSLPPELRKDIGWPDAWAGMDCQARQARFARGH